MAVGTVEEEDEEGYINRSSHSGKWPVRLSAYPGKSPHLSGSTAESK